MNPIRVLTTLAAVAWLASCESGPKPATEQRPGQRFRNRVGRHLQNVVEPWRCQHYGRKGRFAMSVSGLGEARIKELGTPRLPAYAGGRAGN